MTAPAYAAFAKREVYTNVIEPPLSVFPQLIFTYGKIGLTAMFRKAISTDAMVIAKPEIADLPYTIAGLASADGLAASLSTADGLLRAISNALSHDIYYRPFDNKACIQKRLMISRVLLVVIALISAGTASSMPADILSMVAWAFLPGCLRQLLNSVPGHLAAPRQRPGGY
ncbi:unnamed protein product [Polarella glacialis]|uniref:Uncharacterized protein n=1 Tax=Polarella glacialis TaxID=89957 RepID=A0A813GZ53_POLGL|nr:unnamed protein product [Polarella glacialis]